MIIELDSLLNYFFAYGRMSVDDWRLAFHVLQICNINHSRYYPTE